MKHDEPIPDRPESDPAFAKVVEALHRWPDTPAPSLTNTIFSQIKMRRWQTLFSGAAIALAISGAGALVWRIANSGTPSASNYFPPTETVEAPTQPSAAPIEPVVKTAATVAVPQAQDSDLLQARAWLINRQDANGGWAMGRTGASANYTVGTSALALLAISACEPTEETQNAIKRGADFLAGQQQPSGLFGPDITGSLYNHTLACLALLRAHKISGPNTGNDQALEAGLALLVRTQRPQGGWTYLRSHGAPNSGLTVWALLALMEANDAGFAAQPDVVERGLSWLNQVVDEEGRAGYRRAGDHPNGPETLTAAAALCFLDEGAKLDRRLQRMIENIRRDVGSATASIDLYRTFFQTAVLRAEPAPDSELAEVTARLRSVQERQGAEAGSWPPLDRWSSAGGRVYSTALAMLALNDH